MARPSTRPHARPGAPCALRPHTHSRSSPCSHLFSGRSPLQLRAHPCSSALTPVLGALTPAALHSHLFSRLLLLSTHSHLLSTCLHGLSMCSHLLLCMLIPTTLVLTLATVHVLTLPALHALTPATLCTLTPTRHMLPCYSPCTQACSPCTLTSYPLQAHTYYAPCGHTCCPHTQSILSTCSHLLSTCSHLVSTGESLRGCVPLCLLFLKGH